MIEDIAGVEKFVAEDELEPAIIGFFNEDTHGDEIEKYQEVANSHRYDFRFAYTTEDDVREHFKFKGWAVLVYQPTRFTSDKYDRPKARYPARTISPDSLGKFIYQKSVPLVGQRTWKSADRYDKIGLPVVTLFTKIDHEKNRKGYDYFANRLRRVADEFKGKLSFNIGDKDDFSYLLEDYDLELPEKKDVGVGIKHGNAYYKMSDTFSVENVRALCEAYLAGSLTPKIKEEPDYSSEGDEYGDDEDDADSAVVHLTDDTFDEVVNDASKDVMVEFYAPWCGHCQQLKPTYKRLANEFESVESVTIAAMDATANNPPDPYDVSGYPSLFFSPANDKANPITYDGPRELDDMVTFIKEHASVPIKDEL